MTVFSTRQYEQRAVPQAGQDPADTRIPEHRHTQQVHRNTVRFFFGGYVCVSYLLRDDGVGQAYGLSLRIRGMVVLKDRLVLQDGLVLQDRCR